MLSSALAVMRAQDDKRVASLTLVDHHARLPRSR
jgi:hypothetical protein